MEETGKVGIARFVMRTKQYLAAIRPEDGRLLLSTMVYADEVNDPADDPRARRAVDEVELPEKELAMAAQLDRVAGRRLRAREVPGHLPRGGARAHRAQGVGRGDHRRRRAEPSPTRSSTSWPRSRRSVAAAKDARSRHPTAHEADNRSGERPETTERSTPAEGDQCFSPPEAAVQEGRYAMPNLRGLTRRGEPVTYLWVMVIDEETFRLARGRERARAALADLQANGATWVQ